MEADTQSAGGLARNRDAIRITAERGNMFAHPLERQPLVEKPVVPRCGKRGSLRAGPCGSESRVHQPVVRGDDDRAGLLDEVLSVLGREVGGRGEERSRMEPDNHGAATPARVPTFRMESVTVGIRRPDVQLQTVLAASWQPGGAELRTHQRSSRPRSERPEPTPAPELAPSTAGCATGAVANGTARYPHEAPGSRPSISPCPVETRHVSS